MVKPGMPFDQWHARLPKVMTKWDARPGFPESKMWFLAVFGLVWFGLGLASGGGSGLWSLLPAFPRLPVRAHSCHAAFRAGLAVHLLAVVSFSASYAPRAGFYLRFACLHSSESFLFPFRQGR